MYLERQRGVAIHYRDVDGHMLTYIALPAAAALTIPEPARVPIGRWRPALLRDSGFAAWVWKQGDVGCFLVSDMVSADDVERFKEYFARVALDDRARPRVLADIWSGRASVGYRRRRGSTQDPVVVRQMDLQRGALRGSVAHSAIGAPA